MIIEDQREKTMYFKDLSCGDIFEDLSTLCFYLVIEKSDVDESNAVDLADGSRHAFESYDEIVLIRATIILEG